MIISLIVALTYDHVIGKNNRIPWNCPRDMAWFRLHTINKPVIMGRKTFESIGQRGLSGRLNIVLSRCSNDYNIFHRQNNNGSVVFWVNNPIEALSLVHFCDEVMVIGGSEIYKIFITLSNRLYLTYINKVVEGDAFFPFFCKSCWNLVYAMFYWDEKFLIFERY